MKALTLEISKVEKGYVATLRKGGRMNPLSFGKKTFASENLKTVLAQAVTAIMEDLGK